MNPIRIDSARETIANAIDETWLEGAASPEVNQVEGWMLAMSDRIATYRDTLERVRYSRAASGGFLDDAVCSEVRGESDDARKWFATALLYERTACALEALLRAQ